MSTGGRDSGEYAVRFRYVDLRSPRSATWRVVWLVATLGVVGVLVWLAVRSTGALVLATACLGGAAWIGDVIWGRRPLPTHDATVRANDEEVAIRWRDWLTQVPRKSIVNAWTWHDGHRYWVRIERTAEVPLELAMKSARRAADLVRTLGYAKRWERRRFRTALGERLDIGVDGLSIVGRAGSESYYPLALLKRVSVRFGHVRLHFDGKVRDLAAPDVAQRGVIVELLGTRLAKADDAGKKRLRVPEPGGDVAAWRRAVLTGGDSYRGRVRVDAMEGALTGGSVQPHERIAAALMMSAHGDEGSADTIAGAARATIDRAQMNALDAIAQGVDEPELDAAIEAALDGDANEA